MALKEHELTAKGLGEDVDAVHRGAGKDVITGEFEIGLQKFIVARVRRQTCASTPADQRMIVLICKSEKTEALL